MPAIGFPVDQDMSLSVSLVSLTTTTACFLDLLTRTTAGRLQAARYVLPAATSAAVVTTPIPLLAGELVGFQLRSGLTGGNGQCYGIVDLGYNQGSTALAVMRLAQGQLGPSSMVSWSAVSGPVQQAQGPYPAEFLPADPAAGASLTIGPFATPVRLWGAKVAMLTSVVVGNRSPVLRVLDAAALVVAAWPCGQVVPALISTTVTWSPAGAGAQVGNTTISAPMAPTILQAGWQAQAQIQAIDGADQVSSAVFLLEVLPQPF